MTQPSTLGRKPGNDMKKNAGLPKMGNAPAANQRDKGLGFNGQDVTEQRAGKDKYAYNQHSGHSNDGRDVQFPQMPLKKGASFGKSANGGTARDQILGTRAWAPSAGQNYKGNPDKIQDRQFAVKRGNPKN